MASWVSEKTRYHTDESWKLSVMDLSRPVLRRELQMLGGAYWWLCGRRSVFVIGFFDTVHCSSVCSDGWCWYCCWHRLTVVKMSCSQCVLIISASQQMTVAMQPSCIKSTPRWTMPSWHWLTCSLIKSTTSQWGAFLPATPSLSLYVWHWRLDVVVSVLAWSLR